MQHPSRLVWTALVAAAGLATPAAAQQPAAQQPTAAAPGAIPVGSPAPDFTLVGSTRYGRIRQPVRLRDYRGQTVVLAFFFKARTKGWTVQMEAYRDQYATLFNNGRKVAVIAVSVDPDTTQAAWAREESFPMLFASDPGGKVGQRYGAFDAKNKLDNRSLYVIGPDGRVAYYTPNFQVLSQQAYADLDAAVDKVSPSAPADSTGQ